jgi:hypothetical protein
LSNNHFAFQCTTAAGSQAFNGHATCAARCEITQAI